jgi:16S rRNA (cytidine1402-2'-O)-methyltransferase
MQSSIQPGTLYIVGTPIGNLEDMTFRAVRILQNVDLIAAEDTRHTGKLLQHFQVKTPQISYHDHNRFQRLGELLEKLHQGKTIALVTDAGMPGISDPGYELVKACAQENINIIPIPGVSASITGLSVSGLPTDRFIFEGFLPTKAKERQAKLEEFTRESRTIILYEAPHRVRQTLQDFVESFGSEREIVLARELTKLHEEIWRGVVGDALLYYKEKEPKGEYTIILGGVAEIPLILSEDALKAELQELLKQGLTRSQATRQLSQQTSLPRRQLYQLSLTLFEPEN